MVDTGLAAAFPGLKDAVCAIGHGPETVDLVMLTHEHADHVGGAALIPANATIAAHPQAANKLVLQDGFATASGVIGEDLAQFPIHLWLPEGSVIDAEPYRFEVLHTAGHTSGGICLMDKRHDLLLSGDTFLAGGATGGIFGSGNISDRIMSLERLHRLGLGRVLPGHGRASDKGVADAALALGRARTLLRTTRELFQAIGPNESFSTILSSLRGLNRFGFLPLLFVQRSLCGSAPPSIMRKDALPPTIGTL
jgi:hydroxyacylglutathione hydrolase